MPSAERYLVIVGAALAVLGMTACKDLRPPGAGDDPGAAAAIATGATGARPGGEGAGAPAAPARAEPTKLDLGSAPIRNPLNLYDIGIAGAPDFETVGTVDGVPITTQDLQAQSVGAFSRIAERLYQAEDNGYRWLIERVALAKQASAARMPLIPFLLAEYGKLPQPTAAELDRTLAAVPVVPMTEDESRHAATSLWRLTAWEQRRQALVLAGRAGMQFERLRLQISNPTYARPDTAVAQLDGKPITRADLRALAGYQAELARHEYWRIARLQFDKYVTRFLREREAQHLGISVDALEARERERIPPATDAEVRAFMDENPEHKAVPDGFERAKDNLRRLRIVAAQEALDARLRDTADIRFLLVEPDFGRFPIEVPAPRWHGAPEAKDVIVAFHGLGCETCMRGSRLLVSIMEARPGQLRLLAGDYFEPGQLGSYRGALALHCAPPDQRDALFLSLARDFGTGEIGSLTDEAGAAGIEPEPFRACLLQDRFLPLIVENVAMARRLGLERNVPGLFASGVRIGDLKDLDKVLEQIDSALAPPQ